MSGTSENDIKIEHPKISLKEFKSLFPYLARYKWRYLGGFICLIIVDAAQVIIPQFMKKAVDLISSGDFTISGVLALSLAMVAVMTVISGGRFLWRFFIHGSSRRIEAELRQKLFDHLLSLSYDFYQKNKIGDLMARATNDLNAVRESIGMGLVAFVDGTVMAAAILVIIFMGDPRTAALAVLPLLPITLLIFIFGGTVGRFFQRAQETYSAMSDTVQETFAGIRVVKSFVKEWWFIKKFADTNDDYRDANMALVKLYGVFFPLITFLSELTVLIVLLIGGRRVITGLMSPGELVALFRYLQMLIWPLMGAGFMVNMIQRGAVSLGRVNQVFNTVPAIKSPLEPSRPRGSGGKAAPVIEIKNLSFAYPGGNQALKNITFSIRQGGVVGILGRTGSGKSTLIKAITRMVDPPQGTVFVKGVDIAAWDLAELRALYGVTPQDSYLFSDSIRENILYGLHNGQAAVSGGADRGFEKAVSVSAIDQDLAAFSDGWDTVIGERGLTLSGGQKQRVAISRAVIGLPEILILDDSLSAVDTETEKRILERLLPDREDGGGRTVIIISHRVSTLSRSDVVLVMEKGQVSEYGTPRELIAGGGFFARTAELQKLGEAANG
jgi:ATP-binding cassette subfamily B protein